MRSTTGWSWTASEHVALGSLAPDVMCVNINGLSKSHRVAGYPLRMDVFKRRQVPLLRVISKD